MSADSVQQIKDKLNIIDVVTPYVELHKAGRHLKGKSPFTNEKTPSFYVSPDRGMYYCFSTSQGGDMFNFIQVMEGVDFKGALKILAEKANVELVPVSPEKQSERERLYAVLEAATEFYVESLKSATEATEYLKKRGVMDQTVASWRIGFAPGPPVAGWRVLKEALFKKGFTSTELMKAGLIKGADQGKEPYDVFRNRIMFPLFDQSGRVVAFSGRTLEVGTDTPKYVNSPETDLYKKSELLYGYDRAKHGIRHLDFSLIVEGQFDVVMSHQAGYSNTVAVSGTALTPAHVQLLERMSKKVVLALDSDKAGIAAAKRSADIMLRRGLDVKVAILGDKKDPADIIQVDPKEFKKVIGNSVHVIEFLLEILKSAKLDVRTLKLRAREEVIPYVPLLPNKIDQDHFEAIIAESLGTTKDAVHFEVERCAEAATQVVSRADNKDVKETIAKSKEESNQRNEAVLTFLLGSLELVKPTASTKLRAIVAEIMGVAPGEVEGLVSVSARAEIIFKAEAVADSRPRLAFEDEVIHSVNKLREFTLQRKIKLTKGKIQQAEQVDDDKSITSLLAEVGEMQKKLQSKPYLTADIFSG